MFSKLKTPALTLAALMLSGVSTSRFDELTLPKQPLSGEPSPAARKSQPAGDDFESALKRNPVAALNTLTNLIQAEQAWLRWHGGQSRSHIYAGLPVYRRPLTVVTNIGYVAGFDETLHQPVWVAYRLFKFGAPGQHKQVPARPSGFPSDPRLKHPERANALRRSGFDHGHLAPNYAIAVCYGEKAQKETFLMSNICAQKPGLNRGVLNAFEALEADSFANAFEEIWVITGPVIEKNFTKVKGTDIPVPEGFYRIEIDEDRGKLRLLPFYFGQDQKKNKSFAEFLTSVKRIEERTGIDFNPALPDVLERDLETQTAGALWME